MNILSKKSIGFTIIILVIIAISYYFFFPQKQDYNLIDPTLFNKLQASKGLKEVEQLMKLYYPYNPLAIEGGKPIITSKELKSGITEVTLIHDNLPDDSIKGVKIIMHLKSNEGKPGWEVIEIRESRRCRSERGHKEWGPEPCQ